MFLIFFIRVANISLSGCINAYPSVFQLLDPNGKPRAVYAANLLHFTQDYAVKQSTDYIHTSMYS